MLKKSHRIHIILFVVTFFTTMSAGAFYKGVNVLSEPWRILEGLSFSLPLMLILLCHELAHYFTSRAHNTESTLPYFIPAPSIIGTFGAFIKMKSPIITRKALVDIGASGPIVGFVVSLVVIIYGLAHSEVVSFEGQSVGFGLGHSLLFSFLVWAVLDVPVSGHDVIVMLHPVAFAGWIGFFVTSLNLIPIGQLDGGHVVYALLGERQRNLSIVLVGVLAVLGAFFWLGWGIWAMLMLILGLRHPPVIYWEPVLDPRRKLVGLLSLVIFIITFMPAPFIISV